MAGLLRRSTAETSFPPTSISRGVGGGEWMSAKTAIFPMRLAITAHNHAGNPHQVPCSARRGDSPVTHRAPKNWPKISTGFLQESKLPFKHLKNILSHLQERHSPAAELHCSFLRSHSHLCRENQTTLYPKHQKHLKFRVHTITHRDSFMRKDLTPWKHIKGV